jgi:hypothetical protein
MITAIEGDRRLYEYISIRDMVIDSKALGYSYGPLGNPGYVLPASNVVRAERAVAPIVFFPDVKCTDKAYVVHVALDMGTRRS